jgi:hypothetical protein
MLGARADEQRIQRWLDVLRDGSEFEKIAARRGLASVFEQRGMVEEAIELLERNVDAGVKDAASLRWLSRLYQASGDEVCSFATAVDSSQLQAATLAADSLTRAEADVQPLRSVVSRGLATYLVMVVGVGILVGSFVWLLVTFLRQS